MSISGTVPSFQTSLAGPPGQSAATVVLVTGAADDARPNGAASTEDLRAFLVRAAGDLSVSGILATAPGPASGLQAIPVAAMSGLRNLQRELAFRIGDLDGQGDSTATRLLKSQQALTAAGEVQFGS